MAFSTFIGESFGFIILVMCSFAQARELNYINAFILLWVCIGLISLGIFLLLFSLLVFWDGFIMIFYYINLLHRVVKLDSLGVLVASRAGFLVLVCMLCGVLLGLFFKDFTLFQTVPGAMQKTCLFCTVRRITHMA